MTEGAEVIHLDPANSSAAGAVPAPDFSESIRLIQKWRKILAIRWLALFALLGAVAIWGLTAIEPDAWRFGAACGYSLGVLCPTFLLYFMRSD